MKCLTTLRDALADPHLFADVLSGETWAAWRILLIAAVGEELTDAERVTFAELTGRAREPGVMVEELWALVGRRGGKTRAVAVLATYFAVCFDWSDVLAPGERGAIPILAATQQQATKALSYVSGIFAAVPTLRPMVERETAATVGLTNRIDIEIKPASFRSIRSITAVAASGHEVAFWRSEDSANPDTEILDALRPSLATTGGPLVVITSVYARKGEVFKTWEREFGPEGDPLILVAHAPSRRMNASLPEKVVQRALDRDRAVGAAEYLSEWRSDVETFIDRDVVKRATPSGIAELPPSSTIRYSAFVDPAGGSGQDSFTLAIGHREGDDAVLDAVREVRPPFSPEAIVTEFAKLLKSYGITTVIGDRFAGEWPRERFREAGIKYEPSARPKSEIYTAVLPLLNSGRARLLDIPRLTSQLFSLERRTARGGRDSVDHPRGAHDDVANAVCGVLMSLEKHAPRMSDVPVAAFLASVQEARTYRPAIPRY